MEPPAAHSNDIRTKLGGILPVLKLLVAVVCLIAVLGRIAAATHFIFNDGRLAPVFSMLHGNPPFYPLDRGPVINSAYAPLSYVYYFPCGLFSHNITLAIMTGSFLAFVGVSIPAGLVLYRRRDCLDGMEIFWLATLWTLQIFFYGGLAYSAFSIHADAPAILFSCLCVLALDRPERTATSRRALWLSTLFAVLTVWSKQSYAPIIFLPLLVVLAEKNTWTFRFTVAGGMALSGCALLLGFSLWCGFDALLENLVKIPGAFPYVQATFLYGTDPSTPGRFAHIRSLIVSAHIMVGKYLTPYFLCFLPYLLSRLRKGWTPPAGNFTINVPRLSGLFLLLALINLPLAANVAINAYGPAANDDNPFAWFFLFAIFCLIVERKKGAGGDAWRAGGAVYAIFTATALVGFAGTARHLPDNLKAMANTFNNNEAAVAEVCRQSPGKYYFPWNPAAAYAAEGKFYHWFDIVEIRGLVGKPLSQEHFNAGIPPDASVIGFPEGYTGLLDNYMNNLRPCTNAPSAGPSHYLWYTFDHKP